MIRLVLACIYPILIQCLSNIHPIFIEGRTWLGMSLTQHKYQNWYRLNIHPIFTQFSKKGKPDWACSGLASRAGWALLRQNCRGNPPDLQPRHYQGLIHVTWCPSKICPWLEHRYSLDNVGICRFEDGSLLGPPSRDTGYLAGKILWNLPLNVSSFYHQTLLKHNQSNVTYF